MRTHSCANSQDNAQILRNPDDGSAEDLEKGTTIESMELKNNDGYLSTATIEAIQVKNSTIYTTKFDHRVQDHIVPVDEKAEQAECPCSVTAPDGGVRAWLVVLGVCVSSIVVGLPTNCHPVYLS